MISTPLISVLLPVYNCEKYVFEAISSILNQTYSNFELIIIDDCSTDTTLQICKSFKDERIIRIEKEKNSGYTSSLNYGIGIAKGKYIARMDGDDVSLPTRFEKQVDFMEANGDVVVCGSSFSIIETDKLFILPEFNEDIKVRLLYENCIGHPTVMLRKNTLEKHAILYNPEMEPAEDYALWVQLLAFGKLHNLKECLLKYRVHESQVSNLRNERQMESARQTKLELLSYIKSTISKEDQNVYLKAINPEEKLNFKEFLIFLDLKKKLIDANANTNFFNKNEFVKYWLQFEISFNSYFFKNRTSYSLIVLKNYGTIFNKIEKKLSSKELLKLTIKSILNYKVK